MDEAQVAAGRHDAKLRDAIERRQVLFDQLGEQPVLFEPAHGRVAAGEGSDGLVIVYLRDISDQKVNEQALLDAKERAERTDRAKSRFLTIMSHEMRTPLNGVLGILDLLKTTKLNNRQSQYLDVATSSSEVLSWRIST